jgi:Leucine-rich repeat (LRR) protein
MGNSLDTTDTKEVNEKISQVEKPKVTQEKPKKPTRDWYKEAQEIQTSFRDDNKLHELFLQRFKEIKLKTLNLSRMGRLLFEQNSFDTPLSLNYKLFKELDIKEIESLDISFTLFSKLSRTIDEFPKEVFLIQQLKEANKVEFPTEIFQLKYLKSLSAVGCELSSVPKEIALLSNLETLNLANNTILSLPEEFYDLKNLKNLNLSHNSFESKFSDKFSNLIELIELNLSYLNISSFPDLSKMKNLLKFKAQFLPHQMKKIEGFPKLPTSITYIFNC